MSRRELVTLGLVLSLMLFLFGCQKEQAGPQPVEIEPGLSYIDSVVGTGTTVGSTDYVVVHYTGWLQDPNITEGLGKGEQFDSSVERGEPIDFPLGRAFVIKGWDLGLAGMKVGGKRTLIISPDFAYGDQGRPPVIPPSSTLIFDTEIIDVPRVQVEILEAGEGPVVEVGDNVSAHYTGWLWVNDVKGEKFDSSLDRDRPYRFSVGRGMVIRGWDLGFEGMAVGQKSRLIIPPILGYGDKGSPGAIPPDSWLCFEVELLEIEGK